MSPQRARRTGIRGGGLPGSYVLSFADASPHESHRSAAQQMTFSKQTYTYKTVGDLQIKAVVYRAAGDGVRPCVMFIHGGALIMGNRLGFPTDERQRLLEAGFVVVSIDYRLAPETKLPGIMEDLQDAWRWLRSQGPALFQIDPHRVAVMGMSAGGYLTQMAGFCLDTRPKALVSLYGYGDIAGPWYSRPDPFYCQQQMVSRQDAYAGVGTVEVTEPPPSPPKPRGGFYVYCRQQGLWPKEVTGHDPDTEPRAFDPWCPVRNVTRDYPPTMLLHGDQDTDVPYQQSVMMDQALTAAGVERVFVTVRGGGHGFDQSRGGLKDPGTAEIFEGIVEFLTRHTS